MSKMVVHYAHGRIAPDHFKQDGLFDLFEWLTRRGVVDSVTVVNTAAAKDRCSIGHNIDWVYLPLSDRILDMVEPGDLVFVRGGYKPTYVYENLKEQGVLQVFYGANTGRERWPFWDVVLDDLTDSKMCMVDSRGVVIAPYRKPVKLDLFCYTGCGGEYQYDLCIGASNIHDKKGQWFGVNVVEEYARVFGKRLKVVMPGAVRGGGSKTTTALDRAKKLGIDMIGLLPRSELVNVFNRAKVFLHLGSGQNDRSLLEANACGCPSMVRFPKYHPPFTCNVYSGNFTMTAPMSTHTTALQVDAVLNDPTITKPDWRMGVANWLKYNSNIEGYSGPLFSGLASIATLTVDARGKPEKIAWELDKAMAPIWGKPHVQST